LKRLPEIRFREADFTNVEIKKKRYELADVESNRLVGRIEGMDKDEDIIYEGKTVSECEEKFREAVSRYRKKSYYRKNK